MELTFRTFALHLVGHLRVVGMNVCVSVQTA